MKYSRTLCAMFHDTSTAATPRRPFSKTRGALSPSTPTRYSMSKAATQLTRSTRSYPPAPGS